MTMLTEVGTKVDTAVTGLTLGTNLFLGQEPDEPDECVTLISGPGGELEFMMGAVAGTPQVPAYEPYRLQAIVRYPNSATSYPDAEARALLIHRALSLTNVTLSGVLYILIEPTAVPAPLEEDAKGRVSFVVNFRVLRVPNA